MEDYSTELGQPEELSLHHCTLRPSEYRWPAGRDVAEAISSTPDLVSASVGSR